MKNTTAKKKNTKKKPRPIPKWQTRKIICICK